MLPAVSLPFSCVLYSLHSRTQERLGYALLALIEMMMRQMHQAVSFQSPIHAHQHAAVVHAIVHLAPMLFPLWLSWYLLFTSPHRYTSHP